MYAIVDGKLALRLICTAIAAFALSSLLAIMAVLPVCACGQDAYQAAAGETSGELTAMSETTLGLTGDANPISIFAGDGLNIKILRLADGPVEYVGGTTTVRLDLEIENSNDKAIAARSSQWVGIDASGERAEPTNMTIGPDALKHGRSFGQVLIEPGETFSGSLFLKADGPLDTIVYTPYMPVGRQLDSTTVDVSKFNSGHEGRAR